jgi:hypothetical protein
MLFTEIEKQNEQGDWEFSHAVRVTCSSKTWDRIVDDDDLDMFIRNHIYMGF